MMELLINFKNKILDQILDMELTAILTTSILSIYSGGKSLFMSNLGLIITSGVFWLNIVTENEVMLSTFFVVVVLDMIFGIIVSLKNKKFITSRLLKQTLYKVLVYTIIIGSVSMIEKGLNDDWYIGGRVIITIGTAIELWSLLGHLTIVCPDIPLLRLLRKYLVGEIARKLQSTEEEVDKILNSKKSKKRTNPESNNESNTETNE